MMPLRHLHVILIFLVATHFMASYGHAQSIQLTLENPIAPRGGVMAIPLRVSNKIQWPQEIEVTLLDSGQSVMGTVVWLEPQSRSRVTWTSSPAPLRLRVIRVDDNPFATPGQALLLIPLPLEAEGQISLLGRTLDPIWRDIPDISSLYPVPEGIDPSQRAPLMRHRGAGTPLPDDPLSQWRWWLLAARLERAPPDFSDATKVDQLAAAHYMNLWAIGLGRLAEVNPGVARTCCDLLTQTGRFENRIIALWVADPNTTWSLLTDLLDFEISDQEMTRSALHWCDNQNLVLLYATGISGPSVELTAISGYARQLIARFHWLGEGIPLAIKLKGLTGTSTRLERPVPNEKTLSLLPQRILDVDPLSLPNTLQAEVHGHVEQLDLGPGRYNIKPPGLTLGPLSPPHTLAALQQSASLAPSQENLTLVEFRRINQRWELMFVCRRPAVAKDITNEESISLLDDMRGHEAIAIFIGHDDPHIVVVESDGTTSVIGATEVPDEILVYTTSEEDRWLARVTLPDEWLIDPSNNQVTTAILGFARAHADSQNVETAPLPSLPWQIKPGRVEVDLTTWTDYPSKDHDD